MLVQKQRAGGSIPPKYYTASALEGMGRQHHASADLLPKKTRFPFYRRLGVPRVRSGQARKILTPPEFDPRTVQPVASRYTD